MPLRKRRFCNAKQPLLPCKTYTFGTRNNRFTRVLYISYISRPFLNSHAVSFLSNFPSSWRFHGNNRKQHRYLVVLSCYFERSVLFGNHVPEQVERRVIILSERLYLQTITEQAIQHYSQPVVPCNRLLPILVF